MNELVPAAIFSFGGLAYLIFVVYFVMWLFTSTNN